MLRLDLTAKCKYLKVTANDQEIYAIPSIELASFLNGSVNGIERAMSLIQVISLPLFYHNEGQATYTTLHSNT